MIKVLKVRIILSLLMSSILNGQLLKMPTDIKSPDAGTLAKFAEIPAISAYGQTNISIPIFTDNKNELPLNISLNYDTSGLRINNPAGIVGQNWSINSGGVITRTIKGIADESRQAHLNNPGTLNTGFLFSFNILNYQNWGNQELMGLVSNPMQVSTFDTQPDEFTFNFLGKSGKFYKGHDGTWKVSSKDNISVEINETDLIKPSIFNNSGEYGMQAIGKITLKDDEGTEYVFGSDQDAIEYSCSFFNQVDNQVFPSSWYLNSVKDRHGKSLITFEYERGKPIVYLDAVGTNSSFTVDAGPHFYWSETLSDSKNMFNGAGSLISPVYLKNIRRDEFLYITFEYSENQSLYYFTEPHLSNYFTNWEENPSSYWFLKLKLFTSNFYKNLPIVLPGNTWNDLKGFAERKKLDKIKINKTLTYLNTISSTGTSYEEVRFNYLNNPNHRLFLTDILFGTNENGGNYEKEYQYKFHYNANGSQNHIGTDLNSIGDYPFLPNLLWRGVDYWGYYNSSVDYNFGQYSDINNREVNDNDLAYTGMLNTIFFPTGGFEKIIYEKNQYRKYQNYLNDQIVLKYGLSKAGGLRVKNIFKVSDFNNIDYIKKTFLYQKGIDDELSSGFLEFKPLLHFSVFKPKILSYFFGNYFPPYTPTVIYGEQNVNPYIPVSNSSGSHILYSDVVEVDENIKNGIITKKGYIHNKYTSHDDFLDVSYSSTLVPQRTMFEEKNSNSYLRGLLQERILLNSVKDTIQKTTYTYRPHDELLDKVARGADIHMYGSTNGTNGAVINFAWGTGYVKYFGDFDLLQETKVDYLSGKKIKTIEKFNIIDYPSEYVNQNAVFTGSRRNVGAEIVFPTAKNLKNIIDYKFNCLTGDCLSEPYGLISSISNYNDTHLLKKENVHYRKLNSIENSFVVDYAERKDIQKPTDTAAKIVYTKYDSYGNVIEIKNENGIFVSYIYDSKGLFIRGKVFGLEQSDITEYLPDLQRKFITNSNEAQSFFQDPIGYVKTFNIALNTEFNNLRKDFPDAQILSYLHDVNGNIVSETNTTGICNYFEYDRLNRLIKIKDNKFKILKEYDYNYKEDPQYSFNYLFEAEYNDVLSQAFIKQNCVSPLKGNAYTYTVPAKKYSSLIPGTAYNLAYNDLITNGPIQTNIYGTCITPNSFGLTGLSTIELQSSSLYLNGITVSGYFAFKPLHTFDAQKGSYIGIVPFNMIPSTERIVPFHEIGSGVERFWTFTIQTDGYVTAVFSGTALSGSSGININSLHYQK